MESTLYLMKDVDLDPNYNYTIDFDTPQAQSAYFNEKISEALDVNTGYSYIKHDEPIKVYQNIDELFGVNYLMFENNNKTYYAFILNKKWVSDECTALEFKIDVMQTYMFNYEIDETFVEREHQDRYTKELKPIYNLESEQLDKGSVFLKQNSKRILPTYHNYYSVVLDDYSHDADVPNLSLPLDEGGEYDLVWLKIIAKEPIHNADEIYNVFANKTTIGRCTNVNGCPTNVYAYFSCITLGGTHRLGVAKENDPLTYYNYYEFMQSQLDVLVQDPRIISISLSKYPPVDMLWHSSGGTNILLVNHKVPNPSQLPYLCRYKAVEGAQGVGLFYMNNILTNSHSLNYEIENNENNVVLNINNLKLINYEPKLLTKDYHYYELDINEQRKAFYKEYFNDDFKFSFIDTFSIKNGCAILPKNYMNSENDYNNMITFDSTFNELPLRTDAWLTYLSQHKNSLVTGMKTSALNAGVGIMAGIITSRNPITLFGSAMQALNYGTQVANQMAQIKDLKETPDEIKQTNLDVILNVGVQKLFYRFDEYSIDFNFKYKIFNYFYHYGYKCNDFKKPNVRSRYYFNYIKTIGANIKTNIDANVKSEIMQIYDNGITIWHYRDKDTFKGVNNYDYENVEMNLMEETNG